MNENEEAQSPGELHATDYQANAANRCKFGADYLDLTLFLALANYALHSHLIITPPMVSDLCPGSCCRVQ